MRPISFGTRLGLGFPGQIVREVVAPEFDPPPFAVPEPNVGAVVALPEFVA
jgi:hypothetical protein